MSTIDPVAVLALRQRAEAAERALAALLAFVDAESYDSREAGEALARIEREAEERGARLRDVDLERARGVWGLERADLVREAEERGRRAGVEEARALVGDLRLSLPPVVMALVDTLLATGLWGATREAVVEGLILHALRTLDVPRRFAEGGARG